MPLPIKVFTPDELRPYFKDGATGFFYKKAVEKHADFLPHSDGIKPESIINKQRPNEPDVVKQFRLDIWKPITKPTFARVLSSLSKIRRSSDWSIIYPTEKFARVRDGDTLEDYCEKNFPYFSSVTNWVFGVLLKQYLIDANAVVLVAPLYIDGVDVTDYLEPFPVIYNSECIVKFQPQEYAILRIEEGCTYYKSNKPQKGKSYYVVTAMRIERHDQIDDKGNFKVTYEYDHNLGFLPVFEVGGLICNAEQNIFLYESRISGILPNLDEAVAEYTDLQAGKRLNIYPERWEYTQHECPKCRGVGMLPNPTWREGDGIENSKIKCTSCHNGYIPSGPFSKLLIKPAEIGQQQMPTPPAGYIEKDIEIIRLMDESVDKHIYKALAAINFQFLEKTPLSESGIAKEVDKDELNNTVHGIAEDIVALMDKIYKTIAYYRYRAIYPGEEINKMVPKIAVPEHFDLISSEYMQEEIKRAHDAKIDGMVISQMQVEYTSKRFPMDTYLNKVIRLVYTLDPLPGKSIDEKMAMASNRTITRENNIISDNINTFIRRALFENENFDTWELDKQEELMQSYAKEQIEGMDETARLIASALQGDSTDGGDSFQGNQGATEDKTTNAEA